MLPIPLTANITQPKAVEILAKPNPMKPPIVVFDLDGTLIHTAPDLVGSLNYALLNHGHKPSDFAELAPFAGTGGRGMLKQFCKIRNIELAELEILPIIQTFLAHYEAEMPGVSYEYDGAIEFVISLRDAGFKTAICTNKPQKLADLLLAKRDIAKYFDAICGADYFEFRKPDPRHLRGTIDLGGGDQNRAVMFGDSQTDFDTASSANIAVVGVTFGYSPIPVTEFNLTKIISSYREIDVAAISALFSA